LRADSKLRTAASAETTCSRSSRNSCAAGVSTRVTPQARTVSPAVVDISASREPGRDICNWLLSTCRSRVRVSTPRETRMVEKRSEMRARRGTAKRARRPSESMTASAT
jgi:hypothetical protein